MLLDLDADTLDLLDLGPALEGDGLDIVVRSKDLPGGEMSAAERRREAAEDAAANAEMRYDAARAEVEQAASARAQVEEALAIARGAPESDGPDDADREQVGVAQLQADLDQLAAERVDLERKLDDAHASYDRAEQALAIAHAAVDLARHDRRAAAEACNLAAGQLEAARTGRDPFAAAAVDAARERLVELTREHEVEAAESRAARAAEAAEIAARAGRAAAATASGEDPREAVERLESRRLELDAALFALDGVDAYPVRAALDSLREESPTELVPSQDAIAMADEWVRVNAQLEPMGPGTDADAVVLAEARERLDRARAELFEAEQAVRLPELGRDDVDELERAHTEVLEAQDKRDSRLGRGSRTLQRLEAAREAEWNVLDRLGFTTYADFMMGTSILHVDAETERRLDNARQELAAAEDAWHELQAGVEAELHRAALLDRRRSLRQMARGMLGRDPGDDVEWALRDHRISVAATGDRSERLRAALLGAGLSLADEALSDAELVELAEMWLTEESDTAPRLELLQRELAELDADLTEATQLLRDHGLLTDDPHADFDSEEASARRASRLREAEGAVGASEARRARHQHAEAEIADAQAALDEASTRELEASAAVTAADDALDDALNVEHGARAVITDLEIALHGLMAAEDNAAENLRSVEDGLRDSAGSLADEVAELERRLAEDSETERAAETRLSDVEADLAVSRETLVRMRDQEQAAAAAGGPDGDSAAGSGGVEEIEWYLLARLAAQRSVSFAGSLPLVLDGALTGIADGDVRRLLERLERMAASVQVIVVSDEQPVSDWARSVGGDRAGVVRTEARLPLLP